MERIEEARRWLAQAKRDLKAARDSAKDENYEWACFQAQQAAEKAVKALLYAYGASAWGRSVVELLEKVKRIRSILIPEELYRAARELDRHYIPTRYPNAFPSGYPGMYYDKHTADKAIEEAEKILTWVIEKLRETEIEIS